MARVNQVMADYGVSKQLYVKKGDSFKYSVDLSNDFDGGCFLKKVIGNGAAYQTIVEITTDVTNVLVNDADGHYVIEVTDLTGAAITGTATIILENVAEEKKLLEDVITIKDESIVVGGIELGKGVTSDVGAPNGVEVISHEYASTIKKTVLKLIDVPVSVVSVTTGNGVGGTKIYDFPETQALLLGTNATLTIRVATANQADFTDATPEGDVGIGTVAPANADALGTDATDDDFSTARAFTMSAYSATVSTKSENVITMDGTSTAKDMFVNILVDAADIDNDVTTEVLVTGTVTFYWLNLGDI